MDGETSFLIQYISEICYWRTQVRWRRVVYADLETFAGDAESLVTQPDASAFDYVEGFAFLNDASDPVSGWNSVPILPGSAFDPADFLAAASGPVLYCLELGLYYDDRVADRVDEVRNI